MNDKISDASVLKAKANNFMKCGKYLEAIMDYSQAIAIQPSNPILYSNRSLAFLKLSQFFFAVKDAETVIRLVPDWAKGYYRKGQAEYGAESFHLAVTTFEKGLKMCPEDEILSKALEDARKKNQEEQIKKTQTCRRYTIVSALLCSLFILGDMVVHPFDAVIQLTWLRPILIPFFGALGYVVGSLIVSFHQASKDSMLDPPPELLYNFRENSSVGSYRSATYDHCNKYSKY